MFKTTFRPFFDRLSSIFRARFFKWIDRKMPPTDTHYLNRKKLFIFPTFRGAFFIGLLVVLWLLGTNYSNNLILSLAFILVSVFIVVIFQTHSNLAGLNIKLVGTEPAFAGEYAQFVFQIKSTHALENVELSWLQTATIVRFVDTDSDMLTSVAVPYKTRARGWVRPSRLLIESFFPLGLLRCWTYLSWNACALVYPEPITSPEPNTSLVEGDVAGANTVNGGEDFSGLTEYKPGDPLRHIAWKSFASEQGLHVKEFSQTLSQEVWLDLNTVEGSSVEQRLAALCYWALQYFQQDKYYGLRLNTVIIAPGKGESHKRRVLEALALFGLESP